MIDPSGNLSSQESISRVDPTEVKQVEHSNKSDLKDTEKRAPSKSPVSKAGQVVQYGDKDYPKLPHGELKTTADHTL